MRRPAREYVVVLLVLVIGSLACLVVPRFGWGTVQFTGGLTTEVVTVTGRDLVPVTSAVGVFGLAAAVAVHATRRIGRRIVGGIVAVAGAAVAVAAMWPWRPLQGDGVAGWAMRTSDYCCEFAVLDSNPELAIVTVVAGVAMAVAGLALVVRGPRWPAMGARYERRPVAGEDGERATWDALDRGEDPTS